MGQTVTFKLGKRIVPLVLLSIAITVYNVVCLPVVFYVPYQSAFGLTNVQMGSLIGVYAIINLPGMAIGGWVCDRFSPKFCIIFSTLSTGLLALWLAAMPSYTIQKVIFLCLSIGQGFFTWCPYIKCLRLLGTQEEQGRIFGISTMIDGIVSTALFLGTAAIFGNEIGTRAVFSKVIIIFGVVYIMAGILLIFCFNYKKLVSGIGIDNNQKADIRSMWTAVKMPVTWIIAIITLGTYTTITCLTYMSPYLEMVYSMPVALASALGAIIRDGVKVVATPVGGLIRDKLNSTSRCLYYMCVPAIVIFLVFIFLIPKDPEYLELAAAISLLGIFFFRLNSNASNTPIAEMKVPVHMIGTVVGVSSMLGYSTDLWMPAMFGNWLDLFGNNAYIYIFLVLCVGQLIMIGGGVLLSKSLKKMNAAITKEKASA